MKLFKRLWHANTSLFAIVQTGFANIAIQCSNIASGVITARALAPGGRGTLAAIIMWPNFFAFVLTLGTPLSYIYYIKKRPDLATKFSGAAIMLSLASGFVGSLIGYFVIPFSLRTYSAPDIQLAQRMVFLAPAGLLAVTLTAQVQSAGAFREYNLFRFVSPFSILIGLAILRLTGYLTPRNAAFVYLLAGVPALLWLLYRVFKTCQPSFTDLRTAGKLLLGYGTRAWGCRHSGDGCQSGRPHSHRGHAGTGLHGTLCRRSKRGRRSRRDPQRDRTGGPAAYRRQDHP